MAKCPVCEKRTENDNERLCPCCGWEFRYIIGGLSREEEAVYNRKLEISRQNWQAIQAFKKQQKQQSRTDKPDPPDTAKKNEPAKALYSEETPVPDLRRDPFETAEEFQARIGGHEPVPAGKATLIKEGYDIETSRFPVEVSWEDWTKSVNGVPDADRGPYVIADRDLARVIYEAGPAYRLFVRLRAAKEKVFVDRTELFTGDRALPVKVPKREAGGDVWTEPVTGMEFIKVPGGIFMMGDIFGEGNEREKPVHEVRLDGFYMGKYPVTQWKKVMGNNPSHFQKNGFFLKRDDYPVEKVSWEDAQEFARKLTEMNEGKYQFRLPTEAEWEYAARSGGKQERYAGGDDIDDVAWYEKNSGSSTHPVGRKAPNGLGIHDMSGNVWEWCQDWYGDYPSDPVKNPRGPESGSYRVLRGGSWLDSAGSCRSAVRNWFSPGERNNFTGIRLALSPSQQS